MKKSKTLLWLRLTSTSIDLSLIYCIAILLKSLIWKLTFISFPDIFVTTFFVYYFSSYWFLKGRTAAKLLTGIKIVKANEAGLTLQDIFLRDIVLKGIVGLLLPAYFIEKLFPVWNATLSVLLFAVILLLSIISLFIFKRTWWEQLSQTRSIKTSIFSKTTFTNSFIVVTILIVTSLLLITYPFLSGKEKIKTSLSSAYPATKETKSYADFIKKNAQNPVDYIFDLFKKYDFVVISERMHPEYTQYELIFKIIHDDRFINSVGNIFTECGSVSFQDTLNSYLLTSFATEEQLNRSTAILQRNSNGLWPLWNNTNLFDLFKTVNKLNNTLPGSTKVNWYFTDLAVNWETMTHEKFIAGYTNPKRDSIMAAHIIEKYNNIIVKQKRKKALVIMNTRHGYGLYKNKNNKKIKLGDDNTTAFLMKAYPGKVSNVMMNTVSLKYGYIFTPIQNGKWEAAFANLGNPEVGFNFAGSPFGNDKFDLAFYNTPSLTYQDVFTGFIFYKPLSEHFEKSDFPYEFDNFEDTILRRAALVSPSHAENFKRIIAYYKQNPKETSSTRPLNYGFLYNLVNVILIPALILISYFVGLLFFIKKIMKN